MNLTNILPSVIANLVLDYCDPIKESQQRNQKKINLAFDQAQKKNAYDILSIGNNVGWHDFSKEEINEIRYPSAKSIKEDMKFYKKHKRTIKEYLENY